MIDDLRSYDFMIYHIFDAILGHSSVSVESYRSSWSCMFVPTYEIHTEVMTYMLSCHDPPMEYLLGHSVRLTLFRHLDVVILLLWDTSLLIHGSDSVVDLDYGDHTFDDG